MRSRAPWDDGGTVMTNKERVERYLQEIATDPDRQIAKRYLAKLEPDLLVELLKEIHGDDGYYLMILAAEAGGHEIKPEEW
jgi:hypothetical protein